METTPEKQTQSTPGKKSSRTPNRGGRGGRGGGGGGEGRGGGRSNGRGGRVRGGGRGGGRCTPNSDSNRKRGRGGGRGGRSKDQREKKSPNNHDNGNNISAQDNNFSDEDVMIEFMHLMRSGDEDAKQVFAKFGAVDGNVQQKAFAKYVRKYLVERKQNQGSDGFDYDDVKKSDCKSQEGNDIVQNDNSRHKNDKNEYTAKRNERSELRPRQSQGIATARASDESNNIDNGGNEEFQNILSKLSVEGNPPPRRTINSANRVSHNVVTESVSPLATASWPTSSQQQNPMPMSPPPGLGHIKPSPVVVAPQIQQTSPPPKDLRPQQSEEGKDENKPTKIVTKWQPKRFLTRVQEQPGKLLVNNQQASPTGFPHIVLPSKTEFVATWSLPLQYLQQRTLNKLKQKREEAMKKAASSTEKEAKDSISGVKSPENLTIRDALQSLTVGLFRRGCPENGSNHSIISKQVVPSSDENDGSDQTSPRNEYHFEINDRTGIIFGTVPFYSPRTPGNVVLRLYFEEDAAITLATSTCINVTVHHDDLEPTLRFVLSNFKSRKGSSSGSLSCMHSFASVLEQLKSSQSNHQYDYHQRYRNAAMDGAGRATWGCICESRKIVDATHNEYLKKKKKIEDQLEELETIEEDFNTGSDNDEVSSTLYHDVPESEKQNKSKELKDKKITLMGEKAVNERRWREVQAIFATVLKAIVRNNAAVDLLKHDIVLKLRLEYELWCPLCESFANNPFQVEQHTDGSDENDRAFLINYPHPITAVHINQCKQSRAKMQMDVLGFVPKTETFVSLEQKKMGASLCANLSNAMKTLYNKEYAPSMTNIRQKAHARELTQKAVSMCNIFPQGTKVVIFGSSANGFGSPSSDLDMCLQLPPSAPIEKFEGEEGSSAMAALAEKLVELGMQDVDQARLTARIPVIKFFCPVLLNDQEGNATTNITLVECDISMQNPLAVINTSLLRNYSNLYPETRILVAIIKRWAKSRDINNPSNHTLSSYGFIIMLLHFLTTHKVHNMRIVPFYKRNGSKNSGDKTNVTGCPLLPNLQWMNPQWPFQELGTPYQEMDIQPKNQYTIMPHPSEDSFLVNRYFCQLNNEDLVNNIRGHMGFHHETQQVQHSEGRLSIARILASFFFYYAYEFDYKKNVVSLQSCFNGQNEREAKSETDGWKSYGQILCIEDPFETFYDVAHVLKPGSFNKIKKEFVLAYTKIVSAFNKHDGTTKEKTEEFGVNLLNSICDPVEEGK